MIFPSEVEAKEVAECVAQSINPISRLIQIQQAKKEKEPVYTLVGEKGVPRRREFFIEVPSLYDGLAALLRIRIGSRIRMFSGLQGPDSDP